MSWFRIDDGFLSHPKVLRIPRARRVAALGVWMMAGTWSSLNLTDGDLPDFLAPEYEWPAEAIADLVQVGLWSTTETGWVIHDFTEYNPCREEVVEDRERIRATRVEAGRRGGLAKAANRRVTLANDVANVATPDVLDLANDVANVATLGLLPLANVAELSPGPSRPVPSPTTETPNSVSPSPPGGGGARKAARRLGEDDDPGFVAFWNAYPRKVGKGQARRAWRAALKRADAETIVTAVAKYATQVATTADQFIAHPATWLNGERWVDVSLVATPRPDPWSA